jgi:hypothetical protein
VGGGLRKLCSQQGWHEGGGTFERREARLFVATCLRPYSSFAPVPTLPDLPPLAPCSAHAPTHGFLARCVVGFRYKGGYWEEREARHFTGCRDIFGPNVVESA